MSEHNNLSKPSSQSFNYNITNYFLKNTRLTILAFISLIIFGISSVFLLKTTGFPSPDIQLVIVQTTYPGASSQTVLTDVTVPIEGAIKNVEGVKRFSSTSANSFSLIQVSLDENVNVDNAVNKIESSIRALSLPSAVNTPVVRKPQLSRADFVYALTSSSTEKLYNVSSTFKKDLAQLENVASVSSPSELKKYAVVTVDAVKAGNFGVTLQDVSSALKTVGESIPVVNGFEVDGKNSGILTTVVGDNIDSIRSLPFNVSPQIKAFNPAAPSSVNLSQFATIEFQYRFDEQESVYGFSQGEEKNVIQTEMLEIKASNNADQVQLKNEIESLLNSYSKDSVVVSENATIANNFDENKVNVIRAYAVADENQNQIDEVIGGLIGGPLKIDNPVLAQVGWLLGGIQLVFLVMLAFVSWRAALVAAASIPLSLVFSTIYLYLIGESLNTLVLFSLVLVIGLVVDPALVILEAIQRKIDAGLKGNAAVLAAVKDVGNGVFLAAITNIIVFAPFGVLSGFLGQIFAYIPFTIVPATIGSYVVPLVFLAWLGGLILKPNAKARKAIAEISNAVDAEKELEKLEAKNMWWIAKQLQKLNTTILHSPIWVRMAIIIVTFSLALGISGYYTATEQVKATTFAVNENTQFLLLSGTHKSEYTDSQKAELEGKLVSSLLNYSEVQNVYVFAGSDDFTYRVKIDPLKLPAQTTSLTFARSITNTFQQDFAKEFFDVKVNIEQTGPPVPAYQLSIAVYTNNLDTAKKAALDVRETMKKLCKTATNQVTLNDKCDESGEQKLVVKIDDGFTGRDNNTVEILLNREKVQQAGALIPNAPFGILVNQTVAQLYQINRGESVTKVEENGEFVGVLLENSATSPKTVEELGNVPIFTTTGKKFLLKDLATIQETTPPQNIQRNRGRTVSVVQGRLNAENEANQAIIQQASTKVAAYYTENNSQEAVNLGLEKNSINVYDDGSSSGTLKTFGELLAALVIAIVLTYVVLVIFFGSFTQPFAIIYTIPLTFIGVYPMLAYFGGGQIGFLEIIGLIILIGIVENVAIFLIDSANQKIDEGMNEKEAIAFAAAIRFKPVVLTSLTALVSLLPLAIFSIFYRSIAVVIMGGIMVSGLLSLITTPILFIFFRWLSRTYRALPAIHQTVFIISPLVGIGLSFALGYLNVSAQISQLVSLAFILVPVGYVVVFMFQHISKKNIKS